MANAKTKNGWLQNQLGKMNRGIMKFGETVGSPIRKPILGYIEPRMKTMKMMREGGLQSSIMGGNNYDKAFNIIKGFVQNKDIVSAQNYIEEQREKIKKQGG